MSDDLPLVGTLEVTVIQASTVSIHGDHYADLIVQRVDAPTPLFRFRLAAESLIRLPEPGTRLQLTVLMGQVTDVVARTSENRPQRDNQPPN